MDLENLSSDAQAIMDALHEFDPQFAIAAKAFGFDKAIRRRLEDQAAFWKIVNDLLATARHSNARHVVADHY